MTQSNRVVGRGEDPKEEPGRREGLLLLLGQARPVEIPCSAICMDLFLERGDMEMP